MYACAIDVRVYVRMPYAYAYAQVEPASQPASQPVSHARSQRWEALQQRNARTCSLSGLGSGWFSACGVCVCVCLVSRARAAQTHIAAHNVTNSRLLMPRRARNATSDR